ncbi:MAG: hypothetical protein ACXVPC_09125, partial [Tumebacillaceae bacterium]
MRIKLVSLLVVLLASSTVSSVSLAEAPTYTEKQAKMFSKNIGQPSPTTPNGVRMDSPSTLTNVSALLHTLAEIAEFADWKQGQTQPIRELFDPSGHPNASLWKVEVGGEERGYLVTTLDGANAYEFSHRTAPEVPDSLQSKMMDNGYVYAGPMLHLAYIHGLDGLELYNLFTGESLPTGELQDRVPKLMPVPKATPDMAKDVKSEFGEHLLQRSKSPEDDALYATGLY